MIFFNKSDGVNLFILIKVCFQYKNTPSGCLKKNNYYFAATTLIEFLDCWFYETHEINARSFFYKEAVLKLTLGRVPF